jgi:biopolymer transport protein ExbD
MTSGARRRLRTVAVARVPRAEINVTPLVDVVLVLLIVFMVVTPLREDVLRLRVPDAERPPEPGSERPQLVVGVLPGGGLSLNGAPVADGAYEDRLGAALQGRAAGARTVFFAASDAAPFQALVRALDGARRAGAEVLTFATETVAPGAAGPDPRGASGRAAGR